MKVFFVLALMCASVCSFSQKISGCGYPFQTFAITAGVAAAQAFIPAGEDHSYVTNPSVYQHANGSWCYSFFVVTIPAPQPVPTSASVKSLIKVIKSQECSLNEASTYTKF
jgi:hypothetical protein